MQEEFAYRIPDNDAKIVADRLRADFAQHQKDGMPYTADASTLYALAFLNHGSPRGKELALKEIEALERDGIPF